MLCMLLTELLVMPQTLPYMEGNFLYFKPNLSSEKGVCTGGREGNIANMRV